MLRSDTGTRRCCVPGVLWAEVWTAATAGLLGCSSDKVGQGKNLYLLIAARRRLHDEAISEDHEDRGQGRHLILRPRRSSQDRTSDKNTAGCAKTQPYLFCNPLGRNSDTAEVVDQEALLSPSSTPQKCDE